MKTRALLPCVLALAWLPGATPNTSAATISNPGFEANSFTNGSGYISNNTQIVGWTTTDAAHAGLNPVSGTNHPFADNGTVPDGANVAFIQGAANSSLSTVISNLTVGETYKVNFRVNARSNSTPNLKVDIAGTNVLSATITPVGGTNAYKYFAFDFTAAAPTQAMKLRNDAGSNDVVLVDNFSIALRDSGWDYAAWNDNASSGVVSNNIYTHAYNFGSSSGATINGITFTGTGSATGDPFVTNSFSTTGLPNVFNGSYHIAGPLAIDFLYGGSPESITIYGLVPGKSYRTTIYSYGFDISGSRAATFSVGNDRLTVDQDQFVNNGGIWVSYFFTATSTSNTITYVPLQGGYTYHTCGFCNCEVPPLQIVNPSFEADSFSVDPGYVADNIPITGWNGVGHYGVNASVGLFTGPFADNGAIPDGTKVAFIQDNVPLTQVIHGFTNGAVYRVRYFENARNCCGGTVPFAEVRIGGQTVVGPHAVTPVGGANPYREVLSDLFVATNSSLQLAFVKSNPQGGDTTLLIDNVSISQVSSNQLPVAFTLPADAITTNSARLNGLVSPQASPTTVWFQWGTNTSYGSLTALQAVGAGLSLSNLNAVLSGLQASSYHYRIVASNAFGISAGGDQSFTIAQLPVAVTLPADAITTNSARLNGQVNPQGAPTSAWFQYGLTTNYGAVSTPQAVGSGFSLSNLNTELFGLSVNDFHYRVVASNAFGIAVGMDQPFTTEPVFNCPDPCNLHIHDGPRPYYVTIRWNPPNSPVSQYIVYRNGSEIAHLDPVYFITRPTFYDPHLQPDHSYTYQVVAIFTNGAVSLPSNPLVVTIPASPVVGTNKVVNLLVRFADYPDTPYSTNYVNSLMFTSNNSVAAYYLEDSYGKFALEGSSYGWFTLPGTGSAYCYTFDPTTGLWFGLVSTYAIIQDTFSVIPPSVSNLVASADIVQYIVHGFGPAGLSAGYSKIYSATNGFRRGVMVHEIGHDLNQYGHAGGWHNLPGGYSAGPNLLDLSDGGCFLSEYGDWYDPMGAASTYHHSAYFKENAGWFATNNIQWIDHDGDYQIWSLEQPTNHVQVLKFDLGNEMFYFFEYRTLTGFDGPATPEPNLSPIDAVVGRLRLSLYGGDINTLIPYPAPLALPRVFNPGTPFLDPYRGLRLEVISKSGGVATVRVSGSTNAFRITKLRPLGGAGQNVELTFSSVQDAKYFAQATSNFTSWQTVKTNILAPTNSTVTVLTNVGQPASRFFRVGVDTTSP